MAESLHHPGVWCCERRSECAWQGYALHHGLAWGVVPGEETPWRRYHDRHCGGRLIQLLDPTKGVDHGSSGLCP
jgi:hypothetical protein